MKINTKNITEKEWNALPQISEAPEGARYYISEYCRVGRKHLDWYTILDADLGMIAEGKIQYTKTLEGLTKLYRPENTDAFVPEHLQEPVGPYIRELKAITPQIYHNCLSEALNYSDTDAYVSDMALSSIWEDPEDAELPADRIDWLRQIWTAAHRNVRDIARDAGMTQNALAAYFNIPARTVGNWCTGVNECPGYTRIMMQEILGLVKRA